MVYVSGGHKWIDDILSFRAHVILSHPPVPTHDMASAPHRTRLISVQLGGGDRGGSGWSCGGSVLSECVWCSAKPRESARCVCVMTYICLYIHGYVC